MKISSLRLILLLVPTLAACAGMPLPNHGGGKRLYTEQELLADTTGRALEDLDLSPVEGHNVVLAVYAMGDEGGGGSREGGFFASLFGTGSSVASSAATPSIGMTPTENSPYAFANARDLDYLRARVLQELFEQGATVVADPADADGYVYVVISIFGTKRWSRNFLIYKQDHLSARVSLDAFYSPAAGGHTPMGEGEADGDVSFDYFFGILLNDDPKVKAR